MGKAFTADDKSAIAWSVVATLAVAVWIPVYYGIIRPRWVIMAGANDIPAWMHTGKSVFAVVVSVSASAIGTATMVADHLPEGEHKWRKKGEVATVDMVLSIVLFLASSVELARNWRSWMTEAAFVSSACVLAFKCIALDALSRKDDFTYFIYGMLCTNLAMVVSVGGIVNASAHLIRRKRAAEEAELLAELNVLEALDLEAQRARDAQRAREAQEALADLQAKHAQLGQQALVAQRALQDHIAELEGQMAQSYLVKLKNLVASAWAWASEAWTGG